MHRQVPPRIHVLLARESPQGVLICRHRSKQMVTVGWNRSTDEFTLGQWLYGRIEGTHADIAPDGKHWIYGVLDPRRSRVLGDRKRAAWTAIAGK
jgi:hypothetical protein